MKTPIAVHTFDTLPTVNRLRELSQAAAMIDAILMPDWQYRYFSFDSSWDMNVSLASLRDGQGSHHYCVLANGRALIKLFDPSWNHNTLDRDGIEGFWPTHVVPTAFAQWLTEPAFDWASLSGVVWRDSADTAWTIALPASAAESRPESYLSLLSAAPSVFADWASGYHEQPVAVDAVARIQRLEPLTQELVSELVPDRSLESLGADITEIGYPLAPSERRHE